MRAVIDTSKRDPLSRLLAGTAGALRARQQLPASDPRRASSRWLRPNWPDAFLLSIHRRRLVEALTQDEALRQEVRERLRLAADTELATDLAGPGSGDRTPEDAGKLIAAAIAAADDPVAVLESAATDPDPVVASAAAPYLNGELSLPAAEPRPAGAGGQPAAGAADQNQKLRRRAHQAEDAAKSLRRQQRDQQKEAEELRRQLAAVTERAERAEATAADLRLKVPSPREREALASASSQYDKAAELKRSLDRERAARRADSRQFRELLSEAEAALGRAQDKLDAEVRGRRWLEADLGDNAGRRAGSCHWPSAKRRSCASVQRACPMVAIRPASCGEPRAWMSSWHRCAICTASMRSESRARRPT